VDLGVLMVTTAVWLDWLGGQLQARLGVPVPGGLGQ
jgi:hypothetical protein